MIQPAKQYGRYGYGKICELLEIEGRLINHKKVERIWREEGLQLPARYKRRKRLYHHDASIIRLRPHFQKQLWSIDFVHDKLSNGRPCKMLTVLDEYTRQALAVTVANKPEYLHSDNGPEFTSEPFKKWLIKVGIEPINIYPVSTLENLYNERFNGTLRREVLNAEWFATTRQTQTVINQWLKQCNHIRPHHALGMRPPVPKTIFLKPRISGA
jgi:putative transposase